MNDGDNDFKNFGRRPTPDSFSVTDEMRPVPVPPEEPVPVVKRSKAARSTFVQLFNFILTLAILGVVGFIATVWYAKQQFDAPGPLQAEKTFEVKKGATFTGIISDLEEQGIIQPQGVLQIFKRGVQAAGKGSELKAGEFAMKPRMSMAGVMKELTEGRSIQHTVTLPEGWTSYQIMERIQFSDVLQGDLPPIPPEGTILPNTYAFPKDTTRTEALERMQEAQTKAVTEIWQGRAENLPLKTPEELVILASIVERETGVGSERAHVASVFINRLRKGMKLQTDPTVIYGIWGGQGKPKDRGGLRVSELKRRTPYNTYIIPGLPPTPIANPGLEALKATARPLETEDLFFVADGTGGHVFASSLAEHNTNVAKWRKIEAQRKKDAEAAAAAAAKEAEQEQSKPAGQTEQSN